jgi:hypothetical protein
VHGLPHLPDLGLAAAVAHMGEDIDRRVGEEIDVVAAVRQRALDIAGIECVEKIQHALPSQILDHGFSPPVLNPTRIADGIVNRTAQGSIGKRFLAV